MELGASDRHLFSKEESTFSLSIRNMKLWIKTVKLAVSREARIRQQELREHNLIQRREVMTRLGNLAEAITMRRQTKLDQWLISEHQIEKTSGDIEQSLPSIPYQMGGNL